MPFSLAIWKARRKTLKPIKLYSFGDLPCSPVVTTPCVPCRGRSAIPGWGRSHAAPCSQKNKNCMASKHPLRREVTPTAREASQSLPYTVLSPLMTLHSACSPIKKKTNTKISNFHWRFLSLQKAANNSADTRKPSKRDAVTNICVTLNIFPAAP